MEKITRSMNKLEERLRHGERVPNEIVRMVLGRGTAEGMPSKRKASWPHREHGRAKELRDDKTQRRFVRDGIRSTRIYRQ